MAATFIAEIGDMRRFAIAGQLACWAGLTNRVDSSDKHTRYTKRGQGVDSLSSVRNADRVPAQRAWKQPSGRSAPTR